MFKPSGTAGGNVFTTEASLATATQGLHGGAYFILFDLSAVGGTYTFTTVGLLNLASGGNWTDNGLGYALTFANGTTLPALPNFASSSALTITVSQAAAVVSLSTSRTNWVVAGLTNISESGSNGPFLTLSGTAQVFAFLLDSAALDGPHTVTVTAAGAFVTVQAQSDTNVGANAVTSSVGSGSQIQINGCGIGASIDPTLFADAQAANLYVDLSGTAATGISGASQNQDAILFSAGSAYYATSNGWVPFTQSGRTTLVAGVSPAINAAYLDANSRIVCSVANVNTSTALGTLTVPDSSRTDGNPGTFVIRSVQPGSPGTTQAADVSDVEWAIVQQPP